MSECKSSVNLSGYIGGSLKSVKLPFVCRGKCTYGTNEPKGPNGLNNLFAPLAFCACNINCFAFHIIPFGVNVHFPILITSSAVLTTVNGIVVMVLSTAKSNVSYLSPTSFTINGESNPIIPSLASPSFPGVDALNPAFPPNFLYSLSISPSLSSNGVNTGKAPYGLSYNCIGTLGLVVRFFLTSIGPLKLILLPSLPSLALASGV